MVPGTARRFIFSLIVISWAPLYGTEKTQQNYYQLFGVAIGASSAEIKKAYRKLALELHPDKINIYSLDDSVITAEKAKDLFLRVQGTDTWLPHSLSSIHLYHPFTYCIPIFL
jgi:hypothetical protein